MDRELNNTQREVRKKVFEHLALSRGADILHGLELASIVIDLERVGDYTKNIGELPQMMRSPMAFGEYGDTYDRVHELVSEMFELTQVALAKRSKQKGKEAMDLYPEVSRLCDRTTREVLAGTGEAGGNLNRTHLGLVLLLRYLKRVAAHLKNACSALVNPFHQIGFRDGLT
jgi:phosphate uptake regulator